LLPDKTDSFKYWSEKVNRYAAGKNSKTLFKELKYWETIKNTQIKPIPVDREIAVEKRKRKYCESVPVKLDKTDTENLFKKVNYAYNTEINDILMAALAMALSQWNQMEKIRINLEGHGREPIIKDVDVNRTVGWFTSRYPVLLELKEGAGDNISYIVKTVKETLRRIPAKGINYGILKYLTKKENNDITAKEPQTTGHIPPGERTQCEGTSHEGAEITFNYLGQFSIDSG
ncbi:MAG: hypothetical protein GY757_13375, partial [bacterium]|nr:hypothetical protein [bacterium]